MKFSINWLKEWVDYRGSAEELAGQLTMAGLEVDAVQPAAPGFSGVVVARIISADPHPDADKLRVCRVDAGLDESLQIVCGAPNARPGLLAPLAVAGALLPGEFRIEAAKLRGVESRGMLCSGKELGLSEDSHGLMELDSDAPVGSDLREYLQLDDTVLELDLTPNRADCLSIRGIARDVSAVCDRDFIDHSPAAVAVETGRRVGVQLDDPAGCPRYIGRVIEDVDGGAETPLWMVEKLRRSGVRSLGPLVDVTNYVLLEIGQPMHAFDLDRIDGGIIVRRGRSGEKLHLLDESEISLDEDLLVIADNRGPLALAGIMGGEASSCSEVTRNILLESAFFDPAVIMGKSRRFGLHTDSSHRFERGVDPGLQEAAIERATGLLLEICGGEPGPLVVAESTGHIPQRPTVALRLARINKVLGSSLAVADIAPILDRLGFTSHEVDGGWQVQAPGARFDIGIEEDLIEEVARVYGYNRLPTRMPAGRIPTPVLPERQLEPSLFRLTMLDNDYNEAINYSFVEDKVLVVCDQAEGAVALANPLSADMDVMRTCLLAGLLGNLDANQRRQHQRVRLFEIGNVFRTASAAGAPRQSLRLAAVASGPALPEQWNNDARQTDFFDIKGDLQRVLALRGLEDVEFIPASKLSWLHPGQSASLRLGGEEIGWIGALHPRILKAFGIKNDVLAFELELEPACIRELPYAKEISRFPKIRRDLAIVVPETASFADIMRVIRNAAGDLLVDLRVFDVYQGDNIEKTCKSLAIGLILQDVSSTLKDEAVDSIIADVISALEAQTGASLRGK